MCYISLKYKKIKTKKPHRCFSCLKKFPENSTMVYWAGISDGDFGSGYTCLTCEEIIEIHAKNKLLDDNTIPFGFVEEMTSKELTPEMILENLKTQQNV